MVQNVWYLSWNFYHMFVYQWKMIKLFLWNFRRFMGFFRIILNPVFWPRTMLPGSGSRPGRSTDVHKTCTLGQPLGLVDRAVDRLQVPHSRVGAVDRSVDRKAWAVDWTDSICSLDWNGRPGGRPLASNGQIFNHWRSTGPVDRQPPEVIFSSNG